MGAAVSVNRCVRPEGRASREHTVELLGRALLRAHGPHAPRLTAVERRRENVAGDQERYAVRINARCVHRSTTAEGVAALPAGVRSTPWVRSADHRTASMDRR